MSMQSVCNVGSELFRRDAAIQQKQSSLHDGLARARRSLCSLTDKVK